MNNSEFNIFDSFSDCVNFDNKTIEKSIDEIAREEYVDKDNIIYNGYKINDGNVDDNFIYLKSGFCALISLCEDGSEFIYKYFKGPRFISFSQIFAKKYNICNMYTPVMIKTRTSCIISKIPESIFQDRLKSNYEISTYVMSTLLSNYLDMINRLFESKNETAVVKICRLLLSYNMKSKNRLVMPSFFKYSEIANVVGIHSVTVARIMSTLKRSEIISKSGQIIVIQDLQALKDIIMQKRDFKYD